MMRVQTSGSSFAVSSAIPGFVLAVAIAPLCLGGGPGGERRQPRPNVILILADDVSAKEYPIYGGSDSKTPHLDALAKEGLFFRTAWAAPVCGPSRAMLMTGRYNDNTGMTGNGGSVAKFLSNSQAGRLMQRAGYATGIFGKVHHGGRPEDYGFDEHCVCAPWRGYTGTAQRARNSEIGKMLRSMHEHPEKFLTPNAWRLTPGGEQPIRYN